MPLNGIDNIKCQFRVEIVHPNTLEYLFKMFMKCAEKLKRQVFMALYVAVGDLLPTIAKLAPELKFGFR